MCRLSFQYVVITVSRSIEAAQLAQGAISPFFATRLLPSARFVTRFFAGKCLRQVGMLIVQAAQVKTVNYSRVNDFENETEGVVDLSDFKTDEPVVLDLFWLDARRK